MTFTSEPIISVTRVATAIAAPVLSTEPCKYDEVLSIPSRYSDPPEFNVLTDASFKVEDAGEDEDAESTYYRDLRRQQEERQRRLAKKH